MRFWKFGLAATACAACCAPLIAPLFVGTAFVSAGAIGVGYFESIELGVIVLALGVASIWLYRRSQRSASASATCGCAPDSGCNTGSACDVPQAKQLPAN